MARILQAAATSSELSVSASTAGLSDTWLQPQPQYMRRSHSNSFLVADKVYVASVAPKSENNPEPAQYVFASSSDDSDFTVYPDPRGKTMDRGTEITLVLKPDALEYLENRNIITLVCVTILLTSTCMCSIVVFFCRHKHSSFSTTFPIYIYSQEEKQVAVEEAEPEAPTPSPETDSDDEDEAVIEEVVEEKEKEPKTKTVLVDEWTHLNAQPPLWVR